MKSIIAQLRERRNLLNTLTTDLEELDMLHARALENLDVARSLKYSESLVHKGTSLKRVIKSAADLSGYKFSERELNHLKSEYNRAYLKEISLNIQVFIDEEVNNIQQFIDRRFTI